MQSLDCLETALGYLRAGLCVLPATLSPKMPALSEWKPFQTRLPIEEELRHWFWRPRPTCIVTGASSGNLEMLDFDAGGELLEPWRQLVEEALPGLFDRLPIERSPSGGFHVLYRIEGAVGGSLVLARREIEALNGDPIHLYGKTYIPRERDGRFYVLLTMIETRGQGGQFVCHPSPGYDLQQGSFQDIPVLSTADRDVLIRFALALNEVTPKPKPVVVSGEPCGRPGDDFNERGDVAGLLQKHGWRLVRGGENELWCRPGKSKGTSATLKDRVFYVFSSNAAPFEQNEAYRPFAIYALLEHGGDFSRAAGALRAAGFGSNDVNVKGNMISVSQSQQNAAGGPSAPAPHNPPSIRQLVQLYPNLRPPIISDLLRQGETMNIVAPSKVGKSWLGSDLAIAVATGGLWLESFRCFTGNVLIIDNELHPQTSAHRIPKVAVAREIPASEYDDRLFVENLRGRLRDINSMQTYFDTIEPGRYQIIILDAFYRFLPRDTDENDNGAMANIYNQLDWYADRLGCAFVLIHHASKGNQSGKSVTDMGAGAGSQSRATDTHLVLRPHEVRDCVVLEAAVRSWHPVEPRCLRWKYPVWTLDDSLDPTALLSDRPRRRSRDSQEPGPEKRAWTSERFAAEFVRADAQGIGQIMDAAVEAGLSERKADNLLRRAEERGLIFRWSLGDARRVGFATSPAPVESLVAPALSLDRPSKREAVLAMLAAEPGLKNSEIGRRCSASREFVRKLRTELASGNSMSTVDGQLTQIFRS